MLSEKHLSAHVQESQVKIRAPKPEDINFIYRTWLDSHRMGSAVGKAHKTSIYYPNYKLVIDYTLGKITCGVLVACLKDNEDVIIGYLVGEPKEKILHFVYVKRAFWRLGIAKELFKSAFGNTKDPVSFTHYTREVKPILTRYPNLIHDQTILMKKGES